jgi:hypothetical protein
MNKGIDVNLINKHVVRLLSDPNPDDSKQVIKTRSFFYENELGITDAIRKIPFHSAYYNVMIELEPLKIGETNEFMIEPCNVRNNNEYFVCRYDNRRDAIDFDEFLFNNSSSRRFIYENLNIYSSLLNSLSRLNDNNVCFFDISNRTIQIRGDSNPVLSNVERCVLIDRLNEEYICKIINAETDYTYKPLELHVLFYLTRNNERTLSFELIETISERYMTNMEVLELFSQKQLETYKKSCMTFMRKYVNKPRSAIISDIITYYRTWDNYGLSILYLHIFGTIRRVFSLNEGFINEFMIILTRNASPDPADRGSLADTRRCYDKLYEVFTDWSFVNAIPSDKMLALREYLF